MRKLLARRSTPALCVAVIGLAIAASGAAYAGSPGGGTITTCVHRHGGGLYRARRCARHDRKLTWSIRGRVGATGPRGLRGAPGDTGAPGPPGNTGAQGAAGVSGATSVVMRTGASFTVAANAFASGAASCNAGEKATGGGVYPDSNAYFPAIIASFPLPNAALAGTPNNGTTPTGWEVWVSNNDTTKLPAPATVKMTPYVICASP